MPFLPLPAVVALTALLLFIIAYDTAKFRIPNWFVLLLLVAYPLAVMASAVPVPWAWSLLVMLAAFGFGFLMFALGMMGGGDAKLLAVLMLWAGTVRGIDFIVYSAMYGGLLAFTLIFLRAMLAWVLAQRDISPELLPRVLRRGEPAPYGVALALGMITILWQPFAPWLPVLSAPLVGVK